MREFLCSELMHALGIPTTRAGSITVTDDTAERDPLYQHHVVNEKCAVVMRISPSFIRFGSFQICIEADSGDVAPSFGMEKQLIPKLLDFVIGNFYPEIKGREHAYFEFF